MFSDDGKENIR